MIEIHHGYRIKSSRRPKDHSGYPSVEVTINGHHLDRQNYSRGRLEQVTEKLHASARSYVEDSIARPDAYTWSRDERIA